MLLSVKRSSIINEFSKEDQEYWFGISEKKTIHHIDTLYYMVSLYNDGPGSIEENEGLVYLLKDLEEKKSEKLSNPGADIDFFGFQVSMFGAPGGIYVYRLEELENFDVFIAKSLPNEDTPRIQVQLRTRALVLKGLVGALEESLRKVKNLLGFYGLEISTIKENRIDYAFHTNLIQKPKAIFDLKSLGRHLVTPAKHGDMHFVPPHRDDEELIINYISFGSRKANHVFFRAYDKTQEVIEMNYKPFFLKKWFDDGLISRYDLFVYEHAFITKSFKTGCLEGRILWYLEYGTDEALKEKLAEARQHYIIDSSNNHALTSILRGVLPPPTTVFNIEYETKRKFYLSLDDFINSFTNVMDYGYTIYEPAFSGSPEFERIYKILELRRPIIDRLMTQYVQFVRDRKAVELEEQPWWHRIRRTRIDMIEDSSQLDAWTSYTHNMDQARVKRSFEANLATMGVYNRMSVAPCELGADLWDVITLLNDNSYKKIPEEELEYVEKAIKSLSSLRYSELQRKRARIVRPLIGEQLQMEVIDDD